MTQECGNDLARQFQPREWLSWTKKKSLSYSKSYQLQASIEKWKMTGRRISNSNSLNLHRCAHQLSDVKRNKQKQLTRKLHLLHLDLTAQEELKNVPLLLLRQSKSRIAKRLFKGVKEHCLAILKKAHPKWGFYPQSLRSKKNQSLQKKTKEKHTPLCWL